MTHRDPNWLAGYRAALDTVFIAAVPPDLDTFEALDFVTGFIVGARDRRAAEIMDALREGI